MEVEILKPVVGSQHNPKKESKKSKKPLMEKMRRARINDSLNELKSLVLEAMKKDISRYSKMEKADILEMTVRYLRSLQAEKPLHLKQRQDDAAMAKYRAGFNECAAKVTHFVMTADNISVPVRTQLLSHLASSCQKQADQTASDILSRHQQIPGPSFPATSLVVGANTAFSGGGIDDTKFPSPPSSPLRVQERKFVPFPTAASPVVLGNGIPAFLVSNDALHLLPLTLPGTSAAAGFDSSLWRPW